MIEQQGMVTKLSMNRAMVRVGSTTGCLTCETGQGCGGGIFARLVPKKPVVLSVPLRVDSPPVRVGQRVLLGLPEAYFLRWVTLLFALPLVTGLSAATIVQLAFSTQAAQPIMDVLVLLTLVVVAALVFMLINKGNRSTIAASDKLILLAALEGACQTKAAVEQQ